MVAAWVPPGKQTFVDDDGAPLVGGFVHHYIPGTDTRKDTWEDPAQAVLNANPIELDERGQAIIWGVGGYRQVLTDADGNEIWDRDVVVTSTIEGTFENVAAVEAAVIDDSILTLTTAGYFDAGDGGGANYVKGSGSGPGNIQSGDGAWWVLTEEAIKPQQVGCFPDSGDVTASFLVWLAAVQALSKRGYVPLGTYTVNFVSSTRGINLTEDGVTLTGQGRGCVITNLATTGASYYNEFYAIFYASAVSGLTIEGICTDNAPLLCAIDCTDITVTKCHLYGLLGTGYMIDKGLYFENCARVRVPNNDFENVNFSVYLGGASGRSCREVAVTGNTFEHNVAAGSFTAQFPVGVYVYWADGVAVTGNTFRNIYSSVDSGTTGTGMGYGVYEGDGVCASISVTGNTFEYRENGLKRAAAILISTAANATVVANAINYGASSGVIAAIYATLSGSGTKRILIANNAINMLSTDASLACAVSVGWGSSVTSATVSVRGNVAWGGRIIAAAGAYKPLVRLEVCNNDVGEIGRLGGAIRLEGTAPNFIVAPMVDGNMVRRSGGCGIHLIGCARPQVRYNTVVDPGYLNSNPGGVDGAAIQFSSFAFGGLVVGNHAEITDPTIGTQINYGIDFFSATQYFKFIANDNSVFGIFATYNPNLQYTATPTGGWNWSRGDRAANSNSTAASDQEWICVNRRQTTCTAAAGATAIAVGSSSGMAAGDVVMMTTSVADLDANMDDNATFHFSTIVSVDSAVQITITDAVPVGQTYGAGAGLVAIRWRDGYAIPA